MSKKTSQISVSLDSADEKFLTQQLRDHIKDHKDGVLIRPSDPNGFPLVDSLTVANSWKLNYPSKFSRYTKASLEQIVKNIHAKLVAEHKNANNNTNTGNTPNNTQNPSNFPTPKQVESFSRTPSGVNSKKPLLVKDTVVVKRQKGNFINDSSQKVQLSAGLTSGMTAMNLVQLSEQNGDKNPEKNAIFASTPFDDDGLTPKQAISNTNQDDNDLVDLDLDFDSDIDLDCEDVGGELDSFDRFDQEDENVNQNNDPNLGQNDNMDDDVTILDEKTRLLSLSSTSPTPQTPIQFDKDTQNKANVNSSLNTLYNPNAVPYSQRSNSKKFDKNDKNDKFLTKRQQQEQALKSIRQEAMANVPKNIQLKQRYKSFRDDGYGHREAEALARQELGMNFNPEYLPVGAPKSAPNHNSQNSKDKKNTKENNKSAIVPIKPTVTLKDVGGIDSILQEIREIIEYPLAHPEIFTHLGVTPPKGVLLHGPPGSGKTLLANAIAGELNIPLIKVQATEIVSKLSGESEGKIRSIFTDAAQHAPCIIFIDDIDVLAGKKDSEDGNDMKRRIVTQLIASIDALGDNNGSDGGVKTDLDHEELIARNQLGINMDKNGNIITNVAENALEMNNDDKLMLNTAIMNNNSSNKTIIVLGATSRLETIDTSLRRAGRFDREIALGIPDEFARGQILKKLTSKMRLSSCCDLDLIGKQTVGFVGADLLALTREAAILSLNRIFTDESVWNMNQITDQSNNNNTNDIASKLLSMQDTDNMANLNQNVQNCINLGTKDGISTTAPLTKTQQKRLDLEQRSKISQYLRSCGTLTEEQLQPFSITHSDFSIASKKVQPTAKREGFATVPETTWSDVGALDLLRAELDMAIVQPIQEPELFEQLGLNTPAGVLLFGPPGCGKTLVAKAVANASGASFLSVKGPELLNQYVGESERAVRQVFARAQQCSPCVIFFDEIDALVPRRGGSSGNQASERVVNQLLTELDGFDDRRQVFVIAATNRPDIIDPAVLRPGRLDKLLYLPLPDADGRLSILMKHTRRTPFDYDSLDGKDNDDKREKILKIVAFDERSENYSGADMQALVREATTAALKEYQSARHELIMNGGNPAMMNSKILVKPIHFEVAFGRVVASVNAKARKEYEQLCVTMTQGKGVLRKDIHTIQSGSQTGGASR
jgi:ribosome biogenesis ATPase